MREYDDTYEYFQQGGEHAGCAVREEMLRAQGENKVEDTRNQGEQTDDPGSCIKGSDRIADTYDAQNDEQDTCNAERNFTHIVYDLNYT